MNIPPNDKSLGEAVPFENHIFEEFAIDMTAAIQFCIGNSLKIPLSMDQDFHGALEAEGGRKMHQNVTYILQSVYNCTSCGKDLRGNKLVYEQLISMRRSLYSME